MFKYLQLTIITLIIAACGEGRMSPQGGTITGATTGGGLVNTASRLGNRPDCATDDWLIWNGTAWVCSAGSPSVATDVTVGDGDPGGACVDYSYIGLNVMTIGDPGGACGGYTSITPDSITIGGVLVPEGSGTLNTIVKWTPDGNTLGDSLLTDNGTTLSYNGGWFTVTAATGATNVYGNLYADGTPTGSTASIYGERSVTASTVDNTAAVLGYNNGTYDTTVAPLYAYGVRGDAIGTRSVGANSLENYGVYGRSVGGNVNIGVVGTAFSAAGTTNYGGHFSASSGSTNYALYTDLGSVNFGGPTTVDDTLAVNDDATFESATCVINSAGITCGGTLMTPAADITSVGATANMGLTGGGTSGAVTLGLLSTCSDGQVLVSGGTGTTWTCGAAGSTYTGGDAITLNGTAFDLALSDGGGLAINTDEVGMLRTCSSQQYLAWIDPDSEGALPFAWTCTSPATDYITAVSSDFLVTGTTLDLGAAVTAPGTLSVAGETSVLTTPSAANFNVGHDTTAATNSNNGVSIWPFTDGNNYLDFKTYSGGATYFRTGEGAAVGSGVYWATLDSTAGAFTLHGAVDFDSTLNVDGNGTFVSNVYLNTAGGGTSVYGALVVDDIIWATGAVDFDSTLNVDGNTTLGDAITDTHTLNGNTTINGASAGDIVTINSIQAARTAGTTALYANNGGTVNTTAGGLSAYALVGSATATRSAGANDLINYGVFSSASGAQFNWAFYGVAGNFYENGTMNVTGAVDFDATLNVDGAADFNAGLTKFGSTDGYVYILDNTINGYYSSDVDNAYLTLNYSGYAGGSTRDRNTAIYDGKAGAIATFTGSTKATALAGALGVTGATTLGTLNVNGVASFGTDTYLGATSTYLGDASSDGAYLYARLEVVNDTGKVSTKIAGAITLTNCGTGATFSGDRTGGWVLTGTSVGSCEVDWTTAFAAAPSCTLTTRSATKTYSYTADTSKIVMATPQSSTYYDWVCFDHH